MAKRSGAAHARAMRDFSRSLPMALLRAREAVMARFRPMLRAHDLTEQQWRVLRALTSSPTPLRISDVAALTYLSLPSLSRLTKALEAREWVKRAVQADDLRATRLSLTGAGRALVAKVAPQSEAAYAAMTRSLGAADVEALYALLERVRARLGSSGAPDDE